MRASSDFELLQAWRKGDAASGEELFERHFDTVARFFKNKIDEPPDDIVQQTFLRCVKSRDNIRCEASFRAYILAIARNLLSNHFRDRARRPDAVDFSVDRAFDFAPSPSSIVARNRERQLLLEALRRIPLDHQIVLELHYWEQLTAVEIGGVVGLPIGTVKTRLRRAKQHLRESLQTLAPRHVSSPTIAEDLERWAREVRDDVLVD